MNIFKLFAHLIFNLCRPYDVVYFLLFFIVFIHYFVKMWDNSKGFTKRKYFKHSRTSKIRIASCGIYTNIFVCSHSFIHRFMSIHENACSRTLTSQKSVHGRRRVRLDYSTVNENFNNFCIKFCLKNFKFHLFSLLIAKNAFSFLQIKFFKFFF